MAERNGVERRRVPRVRVRMRVKLDPGGVAAFTDDVSDRGAFVRSARVLKPGTAVELTVYHADGPVREQGVVRWARRVPVQLIRDIRGGMGIQFTRAAARPQSVQ